MKKKLTYGLAVGLVLLLFTGCNPTQECGIWVFTGVPFPNSYYARAAFIFDPAKCGKDCSVQTDCIIQMVSVYDYVNETYMYASDQSQAPLRVTDRGWTIDRVDGAAFGYYGLQNDGTFYTGYNITGSNGVATTLFDQPGGWPPSTLFFAVDAAVAYNSATCQHSILGYYYWSWGSNAAGTISSFITMNAWKDFDQEFQKALAGWNAWAPTSPPQNPGGGQPSFPHAVPFPTLNDL